MLKGNTILVTGGSSGVGLELAAALSRMGNKVLICGRSAAKLAEAQLKIPGLHTFCCDLAQESDCRALFRWVHTEHPQCNVLVNNAAIVHRISFAGDEHAAAKAVEEFAVNLLAPVRLCKLFLPLLKQHPNGHIINISTGLVYAPRAAYPFYNATKSALHAFTQTLRMQVSGIRVTEVLLPVVDTPWHRGQAPASAIPAGKAVKAMLRGLQSGRPEVRVGKVKLLYRVSRLWPALAIRIVNRL